jgi:hypothetical protein
MCFRLTQHRRAMQTLQATVGPAAAGAALLHYLKLRLLGKPQPQQQQHFVPTQRPNRSRLRH